MSETETWKPDFNRQAALRFVRMKGRMPENEIELAEWLLEFDEHMTNALSMAVAIYEEHMQVCNQEMVLPARRPS